MEANNISFLTIVVLFKCSIDAAQSLNSLNITAIEAQKNLDVVVFDNSPIPQADEGETINCFSNLSISYFYNTNNPGLGYAYNFGVQIATRKGYTWVLLLDQDTIVSKNYIKDVTEAVLANPNIKLFCPKLYLKDGTLFSPCYYYFKRGFQLKSILSGIHTFNHLSPVNSGMLIKVERFLAAGGYNEKVKLDFSDFQFIERFRKKNSRFFVLETVFQQDFSNDETNPDILNNRYKIYCESARNCDRFYFFDNIKYFIVVLVRGIMLFKRTKKLFFFKTFFKYYL